jgi:hypothetical protein
MVPFDCRTAGSKLTTNADLKNGLSRIGYCGGGGGAGRGAEDDVDGAGGGGV